MSRLFCILALVLSGCGGGGPTRKEMAGCPTSKHHEITARDVAECTMWRAARHEGEVK